MREFEDELKNSDDFVKKFEESFHNNQVVFYDEEALETLIDYYIANSNLAYAENVANIGIEQHQFSATFYQRKAEIFIEQSRLDEALENLEIASHFSPEESSLLLLTADVYTLKGLFKDAVALVNKALETADEQEKVDFYLELADVYEEWEKYNDVIEQLQNCLLIDPQNEEALNRMWFNIELTERYEESIAFHSTLIDNQPYNAPAWYNLAHAYNGMKLWEKAVESFEYVIAIDEEYEMAYIDAGDILFEHQQYQKAIDMYLDGIEKGSPRKEIYFQIGRAYHAIQDFVKSRNFYKKSINIDPHYAKAFHHLGLNYLESNLVENALSPLQRAVKIEETNYEYLNSLAAAYFLLENSEKALECYFKMIAIDERDKRIYLNIVSILYESGQIIEAIEFIDEARSLFDHHADLLYIKTAFLFELGKKNEMFDTLLSALEIDKDEVDLLFDLLPEIQNDNAVMALIESFD